MHTGIVPGVYSNNIKIEDILLDHNLVAKISSYNLPLLSNIGKVLEKTSTIVFCFMIKKGFCWYQISINLGQSLQVRRGNSSDGSKHSSINKRCGYRNLNTNSIIL